MQGHVIGLVPWMNSYGPTGFHNFFPFSIRKYLKKQTNKSIDLAIGPRYMIMHTFFAFSIKPSPDQYFESLNNKVYKIITTQRNTSDLEDININYETEKIYKNMSALDLAANTNNFDVVHFLLKKKKLDINKIYSDKSVLHYAIEGGHNEMSKYLLYNGADPYDVDKYGFNCFDKANFRGNYEFSKIVEILKNKKQIKKEEKQFIIKAEFNDLTPSNLVSVHFNQNLQDPTSFDLKNFNLYLIK